MQTKNKVSVIGWSNRSYNRAQLSLQFKVNHLCISYQV